MKYKVVCCDGTCQALTSLDSETLSALSDSESRTTAKYIKPGEITYDDIGSPEEVHVLQSKSKREKMAKKMTSPRATHGSISTLHIEIEKTDSFPAVLLSAFGSTEVPVQLNSLFGITLDIAPLHEITASNQQDVIDIITAITHKFAVLSNITITGNFASPDVRSFVNGGLAPVNDGLAPKRDDLSIKITAFSKSEILQRLFMEEEAANLPNLFKPKSGDTGFINDLLAVFKSAETNPDLRNCLGQALMTQNPKFPSKLGTIHW